MVWDWTLTTPERSISFGDDDSLIVVSGFEVKPGKLRVNDTHSARGDSVKHGRDLRSGQSVEFSMWINGVSEDPTLEAIADVASVWRNDGGRLQAGSVCTLTHPRGRFVRGRPRDFSYDAQKAERGVATIRAEFDCVDDLWYGISSVLEFDFTPTFTGGLPVPAEVPFVLGGGTGEGTRLLTVGGTSPTWPVFEVHGPITDPFIDVLGVGRLNFKCTLAYDQTLRVDTRPPRGIWRNGAPLPGALQPSGARLSDMALEPGSYTVLFGGHDPSGTSSIRVEAAPAFPSF